MQDGVSLTWAELTMETDVNIAAQNIRDKISTIRQDLPADIEEPMITRYDPLAAFPVISLAVTTTSDLSLVEKTIRHVDQIIVLKDGQIAEQGQHQQLLEKQGLYRSLWDAQGQISKQCLA